VSTALARLTNLLPEVIRGECLNPRQPNRAHGAGRISDATPTKNGDCPSTLRRMRSRGPVTASRAAEGGRGGSPRAHARTDYERHGMLELIMNGTDAET
jgi:hypothetical protein